MLLYPGMTLLVNTDTAVTTHVGLLPKPQWYQPRASLALTSQFDVLSGEDMVQVNMEFGSSLLELASLGRHDWNQIMMKAALLVRLQNQAALLRHEGFVGGVGYGRDIAHTAPVIRYTNTTKVEI